MSAHVVERGEAAPLRARHESAFRSGRSRPRGAGHRLVERRAGDAEAELVIKGGRFSRLLEQIVALVLRPLGRYSLAWGRRPS
jgi:hypothetical protein